jgi:hypothetical protein
MANNTQNHGYMKKERLVLELDIRNICMDTWHLHQGTRMQNKKKLIFDVHLKSKKCHWCGPNKLYDLFTSFMTHLLIS